MIFQARDHNSSELAGSRSRASSTSGGVESRHAGPSAYAAARNETITCGRAPIIAERPQGPARNVPAGVAPGPLAFCDDDALAAFRGIVVGVPIGLALWGLILGACFMVGRWLP